MQIDAVYMVSGATGMSSPSESTRLTPSCNGTQYLLAIDSRRTVLELSANDPRIRYIVFFHSARVVSNFAFLC